MIFTNKHVVVALIVSPILAILAWFAVGHYAGEQPAVAVPGQSYPLVEQSNCRYDSGRCELENEDFKLTLVLEGQELTLESAHSLQGVMLAIGQEGVELQPSAMTGGGTQWRYPLSALPQPEERIFIVASTSSNSYFGDVATTFIKR